MNIRMRNPEAIKISGRVSQNEIFITCAMMIHRTRYGPTEFMICQMLRDILGLLYLAIILCHEVAAAG